MNGEQFYKDHIIRWKNVGGSIRAYCRDHQISYDAFRYWLGKKEFSGSSRKHIKIFYWDGNGFSIWQKKLDSGRFGWVSETE